MPDIVLGNGNKAVDQGHEGFLSRGKEAGLGPKGKEIP